MKPDFLIRTDPDFWPGLTLAQRVRASLRLAESASEAFYGLAFAIRGQGSLSLQERDTEPLSQRVSVFLSEGADRIWHEELEAEQKGLGPG